MANLATRSSWRPFFFGSKIIHRQSSRNATGEPIESVSKRGELKKKKRKKEKEERKGGRGHFGLFQDVRIEEVEGQVRLDDARPAQVFDVAGRRHLLADQQVDEATHRRLDQVPDAVVFQRLQHRRGERHAHPPIFFKFFFLVFNFIFFWFVYGPKPTSDGRRLPPFFFQGLGSYDPLDYPRRRPTAVMGIWKRGQPTIFGVGRPP